jgi:hypothetical protein
MSHREPHWDYRAERNEELNKPPGPPPTPGEARLGYALVWIWFWGPLIAIAIIVLKSL